MRLSQLLCDVQGVELTGADVEVNQIAYDSRKAGSGTVFVCIKGFQTDGHLYIGKAIEAGACAVVLEDDPGDLPVPVAKVLDARKALSLMAIRFYGAPAEKFRLIGITGTNGKTSVTYLIKSVLEEMGRRVGLIGTNQNMLGNKAVPSERTTPESLELQELFDRMAQGGADDVVMEVSSHSLALSRVYGCRYVCGAFTNLTQDHLDFHGTMEAYLEAKKILFQQSQAGVINLDEEAGRKILQDAPCEMTTYSALTEADVTASRIDLHETGVSFDLTHQGKTVRVQVGIPGSFSVYNALCAAAVCIRLGASLEMIQKGLRRAHGVKGRAEVAYACADYTVMIDYAHTPDGLENIIQTVRGFAKGRVVTLFGCGGDRDKTKRPKMGRIVQELSDFAIVTSDNPRTEAPGAIIDDILAGMDRKKKNFAVIENRREAIEYSLAHAKPGDVIILAGKGHETYQEIGGVKHHFDEREVLEEILQERLRKTEK